MAENTTIQNNQGKKIEDLDLLFDDYTIITWPTDKIHSTIFPYLVVKIAKGIYSVLPLPKKHRDREWDRVTWARRFIKKYGYPGALVWNEKFTGYFQKDGVMHDMWDPPTGGSMVHWKKYREGTIKSINTGGDYGMVYTYKDDKTIEIVFSAGISTEVAKAGVEKIRYNVAREKHHFGFIPHRLAIEGRPELSIFPLNVLFGGPVLDKGKFLPMVSSLYEPDFTTYKDDGNTVSMMYSHASGAPHHWLLITYDKERESYWAEKFVNTLNVGAAGGTKWDMFFAHFTILGVADGEPFENNSDA